MTEHAVDSATAPVPFTASTFAELRRLALVAGSAALLALAAYAIPGTERVRPWVKDEGVPVARLFTDDAAPPSFAEAGLHAVVPAASEAGHGSGAEGQGKGGAQPPLAGGGFEEQPSAAGPAENIAPAEYEGVVQGIEGADKLAPFFKQLERTLRKEPKALTRIAHYGDSAVAADSITSTARRLLQGRFGDAGHGFMLISRGPMHYMHKDIVHRSSDDWSVYSIVQIGLRDGRYGYGGVQARAGAGATSTFGTVDDGAVGTRASRFELYYQRMRGGGSVQIRVDGKVEKTISTASTKLEDGFERIEVPDGPHTFSLRTLGSATLYGVALERDVSGVVYDSLGLVGAVAERLLEANPEHMKGQIAQRSPDLLVLGFGGNESANAWLNLERYEKDLEKVVRFMRAGKPEMACLVFAPLDQAERNQRGNVVTVPILKGIVDVQRKVALREGCAFFDTFQAVGGEGTMAKWLKARPRLATSDMRHATPKGYELVGQLYYKALMQAFATYLASSRR